MSPFECVNDRMPRMLPTSCVECPEELRCPIFAEECEEQFALAELRGLGMLADGDPADGGEIPL